MIIYIQTVWELCKVKNVLDVNSGRDYKHLDKGTIPVYGTGGYMLSVDQALSYNQDAIGIGRKGTIDKPYILVAPFWTVDTLFYCIPKENLNLIFLFGMFQKIKWKSMDESTGVPSLSKTAINNIIICKPSLKEQEKIGKFLLLLENTITLHQRKLVQLKTLKQAYLQQLFPSDGEYVPKVRFANFNQDWEQRKMGEMLEERNDQISENQEYQLMSFVQGRGVTPKSDRYDRSFLVKDEKKKYKKTELRDFIYSSNNLETGSIGFNKTGKALISPVYSVFKSKNELESRFISILSERKDFIGKMIRFRQGVVYGQWKIHESDFLNINVSAPINEEQNQIVNFFQRLDDTLTLHQHKLESLNKLKQAYLQKMFI